MPWTQRQIRLIGNNARTISGVFLFDEEAEEESCRLTLQLPNGEISSTASDYFEAMCLVRELLELEGLRPVCFGSSRNVYPSGMARGMAQGLKAYKLSMGQPARISNLVDIFDADEMVEPVSVAEQKAFFDDWLRSLGAA